MRDVFRGGLDKLIEAGVALLGGHTVQDPEVKFGYAVTGTVHPSRVWTNAGATPGDAVILTKPIGTGVATTAGKKGKAPADLVADVTRSMQTLNKAAADALIASGIAIHACTDITGFGLLGHASEVAVASGVTITIDSAAVPRFQGVLDHVAGNRTGGMINNRKHFGDGVKIAADVQSDVIDLLYDPQTSGGLLLFVSTSTAAAALSTLQASGVTAAIIGNTSPVTAQHIELN